MTADGRPAANRSRVARADALGEGDFLPALLARAAAVGAFDWIGRRRRLGIGGVEASVLQALGMLPGGAGMAVTALADACVVLQPTMSKALDRMERDGLVARSASARDRRMVMVALTAAGRGLAAKVAEQARAHEVALFQEYPELADPALRGMLRAVVRRDFGRWGALR